nr:ABC transporter ATP-binding protein [uncultured Roseovarius sp.]
MPDRNADPIVEFRNIQKSYDGVTNVLKGLNLDIAKGEFVTLLGPSGSGKSTLLMLLAGFESPTQGDVFLDGANLKKVPAYRRNVGVVFQNYALFPHMTVRKNVGYPLSRRGIPKKEIDTRVDAALDTIQMLTFADRYPAQLSGGQQQRVALARALIYEPDVVLMDEPLGALDKRLRESLQLEITRLHRTLGMTVLYVTHDQTEALTMSDRVAVFHEGHILQIGSPQELYEKPNCAFVANFIGENNNFLGRVSKIRGACCDVELASGHFVGGINALNFSVGDDVGVAVRPEHIRLSAANDVDELTGTVSELIYHGDHLKIVVEGANADGIMAKSTLLDEAKFARGDRVRVDWNPEDARVLDTVGVVAE